MHPLSGLPGACLPYTETSKHGGDDHSIIPNMSCPPPTKRLRILVCLAFAWLLLPLLGAVYRIIFACIPHPHHGLASFVPALPVHPLRNPQLIYGFVTWIGSFQ